MTQLAEPRAHAPAHLDRVHNWIGGQLVPGRSGRGGPVFNPATGALAREVDFASVEETDAAVVAATAAFPRWRATSLSRRPRSSSGSATSSRRTGRSWPRC